MTDDKWTADLLAKALVTRYCNQVTTANFFEFRLDAHEDDKGKIERRTDLLSIFSNGVGSDHMFVAQRAECDDEHGYDFAQMRRLPPGWRAAFEIKVSRADLRNDVNDGWKQTPIRRCVNEFYYVVPMGLLKLRPVGGSISMFGPDHNVIPYYAGIIEVYRDTRARWRGALRCKIIKTADVNMMPDTTRDFVDALVRRTLYGTVASGERAHEYRKHMTIRPLEQ